MTASERFHSELKDAPVIPFQGECFRVFELEAYLTEKDPRLLFDLGPKISRGGQRFSPPDDHCGLYVATKLVTAGSEFADGKSNWENGPQGCHVTIKISAKLKRVLDLRSAAVLRHLKTTSSEVKSAWEGFADLNGGQWPPTWNLGHEAFASGRFDGVLFPSVKDPTGTCLLIFTERLIAGETEVIIYRKNGTEWEKLPARGLT